MTDRELVFGCEQNSFHILLVWSKNHINWSIKGISYCLAASLSRAMRKWRVSPLQLEVRLKSAACLDRGTQPEGIVRECRAWTRVAKNVDKFPIVTASDRNNNHVVCTVYNQNLRTAPEISGIVLAVSLETKLYNFGLQRSSNATSTETVTCQGEANGQKGLWKSRCLSVQLGCSVLNGNDSSDSSAVLSALYMKKHLNTRTMSFWANELGVCRLTLPPKDCVCTTKWIFTVKLSFKKKVDSSANFCLFLFFFVFKSNNIYRLRRTEK